MTTEILRAVLAAVIFFCVEVLAFAEDPIFEYVQKIRILTTYNWNEFQVEGESIFDGNNVPNSTPPWWSLSADHAAQLKRLLPSATQAKCNVTWGWGVGRANGTLHTNFGSNHIDASGTSSANSAGLAVYVPVITFAGSKFQVDFKALRSVPVTIQATTTGKSSGGSMGLSNVALMKLPTFKQVAGFGLSSHNDAQVVTLEAGITYRLYGAVISQSAANAGEERSEEAQFSVTIDPVPEVARTYAPIVYLHSEESFWPDSAENYLSRTKLRWSHDGASDDGEYSIVDARKLGNGDYTHNPKKNAAVLHNPLITFTSRDHTRPFDSHRPAPLNGPGFAREGFYLDLNDDASARSGIMSRSTDPAAYTGAPLYFEYSPGQYITYWFFYAYDDFPIPLLPDQVHEGDWENVTIHLNSKDEPIGLAYFAHGKPTQIDDWEKVPKENGRPVVFSAKGSHASYPTAGAHDDPAGPADDHTEAGKRWDPAQSLVDVEQQPWYGYGGAWGELGKGALNAAAKEFTGPLGPSRFKRGGEPWFKQSTRTTPAGERAMLAMHYNPWMSHDQQDLYKIALNAGDFPGGILLRDSFGNVLLKGAPSARLTECSEVDKSEVPPGEVVAVTSANQRLQIQRYPTLFDPAGNIMVYAWGSRSTNVPVFPGADYKMRSSLGEQTTTSHFSGFVRLSDIASVEGLRDSKQAIPTSIWKKAEFLNEVKGTTGRLLQDHVIGKWTLDPTPVTGTHVGQAGSACHPLDDYGWAHGLLEQVSYACFNVLGRNKSGEIFNPSHKKGTETGLQGAILPAGLAVDATDITSVVPETASPGETVSFRLCIVTFPGAPPAALRIPVALWIAEPNLRP